MGRLPFLKTYPRREVTPGDAWRTRRRFGSEGAANRYSGNMQNVKNMDVHSGSILVSFVCQFPRRFCRMILPPFLDWNVTAVGGDARSRRAGTFLEERMGCIFGNLFL